MDIISSPKRNLSDTPLLAASPTAYTLQPRCVIPCPCQEALGLPVHQHPGLVEGVVMKSGGTECDRLRLCEQVQCRPPKPSKSKRKKTRREFATSDGSNLCATQGVGVGGGGG